MAGGIFHFGAWTVVKVRGLRSSEAGEILVPPPGV